MEDLFKGTTFTEIAALVAVLTGLGSILGWMLRQWLLSIFMTKKAYYAQRGDDAAADDKFRTAAATAAQEHRDKVLEEIKDLRDTVQKLAEDQRLSQPAADTVRETVSAMNKSLTEFMQEITKWRTETEKRLAVVEDRQNRRRGGSGR